MTKTMNLVPIVLILAASPMLLPAEARAWEAVADGVPELEAVETALQKVSSAKLGPKQQAAAQRAVRDVEQVITEVQSNHKLTKSEKNAKVKGAIHELQGLQSQWELAAVEAALKRVVQDPRLAPQQLATAKTVVADVDAALDEVESGKLDAESRKKKVGLAIQKLGSLEKELANATAVSPKQAKLQKEIEEKEAQLKKAEAELKLAHLQKDLLEKKMQLKELVAEKEASESEVQQRKETAAEHEQVSKLIAAARSLAAVRKASPATAAVPSPQAPAAPAGSAAVAVAKAVPAAAGGSAEMPAGKAANSTAIQAIVTQLQAKLKVETAALVKLDTDWKQKADKLRKAITESKKAQGNKVARYSGMLEGTLKSHQRIYLKARAIRATEISELRSGLRSVEQGDVGALSKLLAKMQQEAKSMQAKSGEFLH